MDMTQCLILGSIVAYIILACVYRRREQKDVQAFLTRVPHVKEQVTYNQDFAEFFMVCLEENRYITRKEAYILYLQEQFLGSNSGPLEESN